MQVVRVVLRLNKYWHYGNIMVAVNKEGHMKKRLFNLVVLVAMVELIWGIFFVGDAFSLTGWLSGWKYCRGIGIRNHAKEKLGNFLVKVENPVYNETGLLASWHFDSLSAGRTPDSSGNGKNAVVHQAAITSGKYGNALSFNGIDSFIDCGAIGLVKTVELYINDNNLTDGILELNPSVYISLNSGNITATGFDSPAIYVNGVLKKSLSSGFNHVVIVTNTAIEANAVKIGVAKSDYAQGVIDEMRLYSYALDKNFVNSRYHSKVKLNYADIRFTDSGGLTLLRHWMEKDGVFWVKVPLVSEDSYKVICVYYGNVEAKDSSVNMRADVELQKSIKSELELGIAGEVEK